MINLNTIKHKLILISALVIVGMGGLILLQNNLNSTLLDLNRTDMKVADIKSAMLNLRRDEKDFLMRLDLKYADEFSNEYASLSRHLSELQLLLSKHDLPDNKANQLSSILKDYSEQFKVIVKQQQVIGLDHESGLYGDLRNAVHDVEARVNNASNVQLLADMLMLRRHEKDFMLRVNQKYIDKFSSAFTSFMQHLDSSNLSASEKSAVRQSMLEYKQKFSSFTDGKQQLGFTSADGMMGNMRATVRQTEDLLHELASEIEESIISSRQLSDVITQITAIVIAAVLVAIVVLLSLSISRPIAYLDELMSKISDNKDLTLRYDYDGAEEINHVGHSLNLMLTSFEQSMNEVLQSTLMLSASAEELSHITQNTSNGVKRQQTETESVATAMNQMTSTVQEVARSANDAAESSTLADSESVKGRQLVDETIKRIRVLADQVVNTAQEMDQLRQETDNINTVLQVIGGIAEQTNLLALNAAIEAARAGEQGRGFAVVADEVRTLASRSQDSTQEIREIIERLQAKSHSAVNVMNQGKEQAQRCVEQADVAGTALEEITKAVSAISERNYQIASAAKEQNQVAEEINKSVTNINDIAQESTISARQTLETSESLAKLSTELETIVSQFKVSKA
ncbi:methyl-accepting chemotaxis protein [Neptunicella marina]|uniref:Methyl-accepting chemotaxis protein n=1 Tax=Neptunicella marina TaxID=2125989 RepID=A0A8J6M3G8_9ALTE|nr:methyl-accepting chemotaxis protein [Neptunicella marina]MBC3767002.1 methyl-accepting chemotaxis protein [Neptunicella marina]